MRLLVVFGTVLTALGIVGFLWMMSFMQRMQHDRQSGIGAVAGGIGPFMLLGIVGILLLIVAAVVRILRR